MIKYWNVYAHGCVDTDGLCWYLKFYIWTLKIASLSCTLFCVCFLYYVMIVLIYTWANDVAGDRTHQWEVRGWDVLFWMFFF